MAKKLRVGDSIRGYRITKIFGPGMMAISYAAEGPGDAQVFLKQYKSPSPAVIWYPQFVEYQQELSRRVSPTFSFLAMAGARCGSGDRRWCEAPGG